MENLATQVSELYHDPNLYSTPDMFSPPAERRPHVLRFELTQGCEYGQCTYCCGYGGVSFKRKSLEEYLAHVDTVWKKVDPKLASSLRRVFIGGGDALAVETTDLQRAIEYTRNSFQQKTGILPNRIAVYGRTPSILKQGNSGLSALAQNTVDGGNNGLTLVYWGIESGSDEVLSYVRKGCTSSQHLKAGRLLRNSRISTSVMIMPGLGGMKFYRQHLYKTAKLLGAIRPRYITFMGVKAAENSPYQRLMKEEVSAGTNRPLTDDELIQQMADIVKAMPTFYTKVGCYDTHVDQVGHNPFSFGSAEVFGRGSLDQLVSRIATQDFKTEKIELAQKGRAFVEKLSEKNQIKWNISDLICDISKFPAVIGIGTILLGGGLSLLEKMAHYDLQHLPFQLLVGGALLSVAGFVSAGIANYKYSKYEQREKLINHVLYNEKYQAILDDPKFKIQGYIRTNGKWHPRYSTDIT